jgi:hypothetical protein
LSPPKLTTQGRLEVALARAAELFDYSRLTTGSELEQLRLDALDCLKLGGPLLDRIYEELKELDFHPPMPAGPSKPVLFEKHCYSTLARLKTLLELAREIVSAPDSGSDPARREAQSDELPEGLRKGEYCERVVEEMRRVRNLVLGTGATIAQVKSEQPSLAVWNLREQLSAEDKETFDHPNQWGPVVGYAKLLLGKAHGRSPDTITGWIKAYRKYPKAQRKPLQ